MPGVVELDLDPDGAPIGDQFGAEDALAVAAPGLDHYDLVAGATAQ